MTDRTLAAAGGAAFVVIGLAGGPLLPQPPSAHPGVAKVASYFSQHHGALVAGSTLAAVAALALLPLLVGLGALIGGLAGDTVRAAGTLLVSVSFIGAVLQAGVALHARDLDPHSLPGAFAVERAIFYAGPALAVALVAVSAALGGGGVLPGWHRAASAVLAVIALVAGVVQLGWDNKATTAMGFAGFLLTVVWVAATSVAVWRSDRAAAPVAEPALGRRPNPARTG
jgi:hypothetical protein